MNHQLQRVRRDGAESGKLEFSEPQNASRRTVGLPQRVVGRTGATASATELAADPVYEYGSLVFATGLGTPLDAQNVFNRHFKPLLGRAELPDMR